MVLEWTPRIPRKAAAGGSKRMRIEQIRRVGLDDVAALNPLVVPQRQGLLGRDVEIQSATQQLLMASAGTRAAVQRSLTGRQSARAGGVARFVPVVGESYERRQPVGDLVKTRYFRAVRIADVGVFATRMLRGAESGSEGAVESELADMVVPHDQGRVRPEVLGQFVAAHRNGGHVHVSQRQTRRRLEVGADFEQGIAQPGDALSGELDVQQRLQVLHAEANAWKRLEREKMREARHASINMRTRDIVRIAVVVVEGAVRLSQTRLQEEVQRW